MKYIRTENVITTGTLAKKIVPVINFNCNLNYFKVYATNNALDSERNVKWEDITLNVINKTDYFFKNDLKENENGAISLRIEYACSDVMQINEDSAEMFIIDDGFIKFDEDGLYVIGGKQTTKGFEYDSDNNWHKCQINKNYNNEVVNEA